MEEQATPAPADNQTTEKSLEELTNEAFSQEGIPQLNEVRQSPQSDAPEEEPASVEGTPAQTQSGQVSDISEDERKFLEEIRALKEISGTPFKSPADLVKSYKEVQSQWTKDHEFVTKVKPYEQLLNDVTTDANFANFLQQAAVLYKNPQLASAYINPSGNLNSPPDPRSYNMFDDADLQRYQKDQADYMARQLDARLNARFSTIEQQTRIEKAKAELKGAFPDVNPDEVLDWVQKKGTNWSLVDAYKIREFDNIKTKALEEARKELNQKLETAGKTTTPTTSASPKGGVKVEDILSHIARYGGDSARKKFGEKNFNDALRMSTDF